MSNVTRVEAIYLAAAAKAEAEREEYLESACGGDVELRRQVDALLAVHPKVGRFLEPPADLTHGYTPGADPEPEAVIAGTLIAGRYKLLERIGEGGMGDVWVAEQTEPVKRKVAVKLIKAGMDSKAVLARFEAERQALAVMDHPNIAKVLDGGLHDGKPYFIMELVKGVPITDFCDARKLTPKERLELFLPVCQAIQHAHMKGIIHRDIKPSNVLVALYDDRPIPKVIDFGIAKAAGQTLTNLTLHTGYGTVVGTPEYMSPEQASFNNLDIDTRSDVYSLGVLLYELLTGTTPVDRKSLKEAALLEVLRIVREVEAPRPSQKLSTNATLASIAANRGMEPTKLPKLMRGELDWILLKALEKDRGRRYESANGLAADVGRYLSGEAVNACPPTLGYRLRKAYWRNRAAVWIGLMFTLMLLTGVGVASVLAIQARRAETMARLKEQEAQEQRKEAEGQRQVAEDNKNAWLEISDVYMEAAIDAEVRNNSARIDADLLEYKADSRVGLLRLARPLKHLFTIPAIGPNFKGTNYISLTGPELVKLREFQTAAVITAGQEFVPLLPSFETPFDTWTTNHISSDARFCIGVGSDGLDLELLSIPRLSRIGVLRESTERVVQYGITADSKTIYTQDTDSIIRFWNTDGTFRAKTPLRPERFIYPAGKTIDEVRRVARDNNPVFVADGVTLIGSKTGQYDLYSSQTGQFIRRLKDRKDWTIGNIQIEANGRWLIYYEELRNGADGVEDQAIVIVSATDGRELARLQHPVPEKSLKYSISPSGKWIITYQYGVIGGTRTVDMRLWDTTTWKPVDDPALNAAIAPLLRQRTFDPSFVTDEIVTLGKSDGWDSSVGVLRLGQPGPLVTWEKLGYDNSYRNTLVSELGGTLIRCGWVLTEAKTLQRLKPPEGRKYAMELAKLAPDGRFFENLDTVTEKELPVSFAGRVMSEFGRLTFNDFWFEIDDGRRGYDGLEVHFLPDPKRLNFSPELLQLWAQVVTGGELGSDGRFEAWDQPTWAAKQKALAAMKPPYADFPFPGWAATEPHLWYRIQATRTTTDKSEKFIKEWRRRSGRIHPHDVKDPWRTPGPALELAPLPRSAATGAK